jgi:hypothetical protein
MSDVLVEPRLMTLKETAAFLRMSMSTLYQNKQIPRYRLPGTRRWLYDKEELLAYIKCGGLRREPSERGARLQIFHGKSL